jgi:hypothetical protein
VQQDDAAAVADLGSNGAPDKLSSSADVPEDYTDQAYFVDNQETEASGNDGSYYATGADSRHNNEEDLPGEMSRQLLASSGNADAENHPALNSRSRELPKPVLSVPLNYNYQASRVSVCRSPAPVLSDMHACASCMQTMPAHLECRAFLRILHADHA